MIETHVVNALLLNELKHGMLYSIITFINGLVAPSFLFCAGFAFAISSHRRWDEFSSYQGSSRRYSLRLLFIMLVGYALHVPFYSLSRMSHVIDEPTWTSFFMVDILQVIAATLLILVLLSSILKREPYLFGASLVLCTLIILVSPLVNRADFPSLPVWLRGYVSVKYFSQFTLFPWAGFLLAGFLLGYGFVRMPETNRSSSIRKVSIIAIGVLLCSILCEVIPFNLYPEHSFWNSPQFVFLRLGLVVLIGSLLWYLESRSTPENSTSQWKLKSFILIFGTESLLVYTLHLMVVYGRTFSWSFISVFGSNLGYAGCFGLFALLTAAMYVLASAWSTMKTWNIKYARWVQYAVVAAVSLEFVIAS